MVRHVILWKLCEGDESFRAESKARIKRELEALQDRIPGLIRIRVYTEPMASSNADLMLDSLFTDEAALAGYQNHPEHLAAASFVRSVVCDRTCMDFAEPVEA